MFDVICIVSFMLHFWDNVNNKINRRLWNKTEFMKIESMPVIYVFFCAIMHTHYTIGVASYGALGHVPPTPRLPASYFGDHSHSLYRLWRIMRTVFCPVERFMAIGSAGGNSNVVIFSHSFPQGVIIVAKMPERSPINLNSTRTSDSGKTGS